MTLGICKSESFFFWFCLVILSCGCHPIHDIVLQDLKGKEYFPSFLFLNHELWRLRFWFLLFYWLLFYKEFPTILEREGEVYRDMD